MITNRMSRMVIEVQLALKKTSGAVFRTAICGVGAQESRSFLDLPWIPPIDNTELDMSIVGICPSSEGSMPSVIDRFLFSHHNC